MLVNADLFLQIVSRESQVPPTPSCIFYVGNLPWIINTLIMHLSWFNVFSLGEATCVAKRLDARYDWLPSPNTLAKYGHLLVVYVGDACSPDTFLANVTGNLALVSSSDTGACSYFTKVRFCKVYTTQKKFG